MIIKNFKSKVWQVPILGIVGVCGVLGVNGNSERLAQIYVKKKLILKLPALRRRESINIY